MANRFVTSGCAVCLSVIMIEVIVAYDTNETRERLNCVASLSVEQKITWRRKPLVGFSSEDLALANTMGVYNSSSLTSDPHLVFWFARYGILESGYAAPIARHPKLGEAAESCQSYA